jgi:hypothetical protein
MKREITFVDSLQYKKNLDIHGHLVYLFSNHFRHQNSDGLSTSWRIWRVDFSMLAVQLMCASGGQPLRVPATGQILTAQGCINTSWRGVPMMEGQTKTTLESP